MNGMLIILLIIAALVATMTLAIYIPTLIGHLVHTHRHPEDAELVAMYLERVRDDPDSFALSCANSITAKDGVFEATDFGSLQAGGRSVARSSWQSSKVGRSVRRLWKRNGRTDARKKALLDRLKSDG